MSLFEEPLAAHLAEEPVLVLGLEVVAIPWRDEVRTYAAICHPDGRGAMVNWELLKPDWRYVEADERWYDLADIRAQQEALEAPAVDEAT